MSLDTVSVAGLNIHWGRGTDGSAFALPDACRSLGADVICLQEVWTPANGRSAVAVAAETLGYTVRELPLTDLADINGFRVVRDEHEATGSWGLALATTLPLVAHEIIDLGRAPGDTVRRAAQMATLETPGGRRLHVVNTHLTHRLYASPFQLRRLVSHLRKLPYCVVVGDLNMVGPLAAFVSRRQRAVRGRTWPAQRPVAQLDHVLIGPDITAANGVVFPSVGSDHLPVHVRLMLGRSA